MSRDIVVKAPPAILHTGMRAELEAQKAAAETLANVAMGLVQILIDKGYGLDGDTVAIPDEIRRRMDGGRLTVDQAPDGGLVVRIVARGDEHLIARRLLERVG